ncbi:hypothetical protein BOTNAR_0467g00060 [Botryotinia narcissicola]|uniref:Uncharacterized protein n=1 Tax=Botryotinia narcissicola TaxID=278944 RepID=A0A4Z1HII2_9HELO|nr:hypothetical protein BOTNAR_0467g00060 [Botryotinia narcissicola]
MSGLRTSIWAPGSYRSPSYNGSSYKNPARENAPVSTTHSYTPRETSKNRAIETTREMILDGKLANNEPRKSSGGLGASQWAPRDYPGISKTANRQEVLTMVTPASQHKPMAHAYNGSSPAYTSPDLGLPYEVQHYILGMMQRIMEEGCYTFASRWIPDVLQRNNWTCSEAVELFTWRTVLPENVPSEAFTSHGKSLHQCLANAVRIRNSATHRHIFSSQELRGLAQQAEDLMSLLSDYSRQLKFHKLWTELYDWEKLNVTDMQAARHKMETALQQIGERPMEDDMDWTPNVISLEKVPAVEIGPEEVENHEVHDAMEID